MPIVKKQNLNPSDISNFRPISNLLVMSKLLEKAVAWCLIVHLEETDLMPCRQSAYRWFHSTEILLLCDLSDLIYAIESSNLTLLTLVGMSVALNSGS